MLSRLGDGNAVGQSQCGGCDTIPSTLEEDLQIKLHSDQHSSMNHLRVKVKEVL